MAKDKLVRGVIPGGELKHTFVQTADGFEPLCKSVICVAEIDKEAKALLCVACQSEEINLKEPE